MQSDFETDWCAKSSRQGSLQDVSNTLNRGYMAMNRNRGDLEGLR